MSIRTKNIAKAMRKAKQGKVCISCGASQVDGAHILPRGSYPEFADWERNIMPLCRKCHMEFDVRDDINKGHFLEKIGHKSATWYKILLESGRFELVKMLNRERGNDCNK